MRSTFMLDEPQLSYVEAKLAELNALSAAEQTRKQCLIDALLRERKSLLCYRARRYTRLPPEALGARYARQ